MKKFLTLLLLLLTAGSLSHSADLTMGAQTPNGQYYNKSWRDIKDGTNGETFDAVTANTFSLVATTTTVKATPGYIDGIWVANFMINGCVMRYPIQVWDNTSAATTPMVQVSTNTIFNGYIPIRSRFATGLTVSVDAICTNPPSVTVSYR